MCYFQVFCSLLCLIVILNILKKIDYLKAFDNALPADKDFNIYKYIDLRYKDQIVVKERRV